MCVTSLHRDSITDLITGFTPLFNDLREVTLAVETALIVAIGQVHEKLVAPGTCEARRVPAYILRVNSNTI